MENKELVTTEEEADVVKSRAEAKEEARSEGRPPKKRAAIAVLIAILFVYLAGAAYSTFVFLPNTSLRGTDISGLSADAANEKLKEEGLVLTVQQKPKHGNIIVTETIDLKEVAGAEMNYDTGGLLNDQDKFLWFKSFFVPTDFQECGGSGTFDENRLKLAVGSLYSQRPENIQAPEDAHLVPRDGYIAIIPEIEGNEVTRAVATQAIVDAAKKAVRGGGSHLVDFVELCTPPEARTTDAEFLETKKKMEEMAIRTITLNINDENKEELMGESIVRLLKMKGTGLVVDDEAIDSYVDELYEKYYVCRYEYIKKDELKASLASALDSTHDETISCPWYINYPYPGCKGNGSPSYIELSISEQTLWYYENGELILTSGVVTGDPKKFPTITGYLEITEKETNAKLVGLPDPKKKGKPEYEVTVNYWMGITPYYGLHDATGRSSFGGNIYTYDGSHGCINLPYSVAEALFARTFVGTEVYIY